MSYNKDICTDLFFKGLLSRLQTDKHWGCPCQGFDSKGDKRSNMRRLRLLCAGHNWFLSAPTDLTQDIDEPIMFTHTCDNIFNKSKKTWTAGEEEKKWVRNSSVSTNARGAEKVLQTLEQKLPCGPLKSPHWSRELKEGWEDLMPEQFFPCRAAAHGRAHTRAGERYQMEGETERICYRLTVPIPMPHTTCGVGGRIWERWSWAWKRERKDAVLFYCSFLFLTTWIYFHWQYI